MAGMALTQAVRKTFHRAAPRVCVVATAGAAQAETLADALVGAYNNSGLLDQNRALLRAADEDVAGAAAALEAPGGSAGVEGRGEDVAATA